MPRDSLEGGDVGHSFLDMTPLRRQEIPLLGGDKELPSIPKFSRFAVFPSSASTPTVNYIARISLFVLLELGFILLGALSLTKPIVIGFPASLNEGKGAFTVLFILWQTIAVLPLQHVILCTFSHEWSLQWAQERTSLEDLDRIDQVSILTSGTSARVRHLFRGESSKSFKLALTTSLALLGLLKVGPGAVGLATVRRNRQVPVIMGKLTLTNQTPEQSKSLVLQRAHMITGLEQFGSSLYGFDVQPNHIFGWILEGAKDNGVEITYPSDLIKFNYSCHWEVPELSEEGGALIGGGARWTLGEQNVQEFPDGGIIPTAPVGETPLSAYLFYGSNSTYGATNSSGYVLDMGGVPSLANRTGIRDPRLPVKFSTPLLSMLICDPQMQITGGQVHLLRNGSVFVEPKGLPSVGNVPQSAANFLFSQGLLAATQQADTTTQHLPLSANQFSSQMFLQLNSTDPAATYAPLDLNSIARNINTFLLSASKAFSDGYSPATGNPGASTFATMPVLGTFQEEVIALTASEAFLITTIILSLLVVVLTTALYMNVPESLQLFNLETIIQCLGDSVRIPERSQTSEQHLSETPGRFPPYHDPYTALPDHTYPPGRGHVDTYM